MFNYILLIFPPSPFHFSYFQAFSLHGHNHSEEEEAGAEEEDQSFIWKGCVVIVGTYFFFLFETILHKLTAQQAQQVHMLSYALSQNLYRGQNCKLVEGELLSMKLLISVN